MARSILFPLRLAARIVSPFARAPIFSLISFALLALASWLWIDSRRQSSVLEFATFGGRLQALGSDRTGIVFFNSDAPLGREMQFTADIWRVPAADAAVFHDAIYQKPIEKWHVAGFHYADGTWDLAANQPCRWQALLVPYWVLLPLLALLPARGLLAWIVRIRRRWRGECLQCGYDLRCSTDRCPECGAPVVQSGSRWKVIIPAIGGEHGKSALPRPATILALLLLACALAIALRSGTRGAMRDPFDAECRAAGLERRLPEIYLSDLTPREAFERLQQATGADIRPDWPSLRRIGVLPDTYHIGHLPRLRDATLEQALVAVLGYNGGYEVSRGTIILGSRDDLPHILRVYDLHGVIAAAEFSRPYVPPPPPLSQQILAQQIALMQVRQAQFRARPATTIPVARAPARLVSSPPIALVAPSPPVVTYRTSADGQAVEIRRKVVGQFLDWFVAPPTSGTTPHGSVRAEVFSVYLSVYQTRQIQREIRRMLEEVRQHAGTGAP